jgi:hypothetical protein
MKIRYVQLESAAFLTDIDFKNSSPAQFSKATIRRPVHGAAQKGKGIWGAGKKA